MLIFTSKTPLMILKAFLTALLLSMFTALQVSAELTGRVVDKTSGAPLEFVNVVAMSADSAYMTGCTTDSIGRFSLPTATNPAIVGFSVIGYEKRTLPAPAAGSFGDVALTTAGIQLAEVTVENRTPATRLQGSSFITTVAGTFMSTLISAADVMQWIPGLTVSNKQIRVFQKSNPLIYINNRKINSFTDVETLEASNIASIEVISDPGVKYGIGTDCVIIIHTRRNLADSFSTSLISTNTVANHYSNSEIINLTFRQKGLELTAKGLFSHSDLLFANEITEESFSTPAWNKELSQTVRHKDNGGFAEIGISYDFSPTRSVGARYQFNGTRSTEANTVDQLMNFADGAKNRNLTLGESHYTYMPNHYANIYYNGAMGKITLDFNGDILSADNSSGSLSVEQSSLRPDYSVSTHSSSSTFMAAEKLTATIKLDKLQVMVGEEVSHTRMESTFSNPEQIVADNSSLSQENNIAVFAELSATFGKISASAGARYEHTDATYRFTQAETETTRRKLNNWYPSVSFNGRFGNTTVSASYDYRTLRPSYSQLDASIVYIDPYSLKQGNPLLESVALHNLNVSAQWKQVWGNFYFSDRANPILNCFVPFAPDSPILVSTFRNFNPRRAVGANIGADFTLGLWYCSGSVAFRHQWFSMPFKGGNINLDGNMYGLNLNNRLSLPWELKLNINYSMYSACNNYNTHYRPTYGLNASLSRSFLKEALYVEFGANDILQKNSSTSTSYDNYILRQHTNIGDRRRFNLSLRYSFNATRSRYKGTGAGQSELNRL